MPTYCLTCGHIMDRHHATAYRKGTAPCNSKIKSGLCTCRGFVRVQPKAENDKPKKEGPKPKAEDCIDKPPPKIGD